MERSDERIQARNDEDYDEEAEEDLQIEDEEARVRKVFKSRSLHM